MIRRCLSMLAPAALALFALTGWVSPAHALFHAYEVCLRLPVTIDDESGLAREAGFDGNWVARGIEIASVRAPDGTMLTGYPQNADAEDGCFHMVTIQEGQFRIGIRPRGEVRLENTIAVRNTAGNVATHFATFDIDSSGTFVWPSEIRELRVYAITAYAIQQGFAGNYDDEDLTIWMNNGAPCDSNPAACTGAFHCVDGGNSHLTLCTATHTTRKFVIGHEYGHANLARSVSTRPHNDCSYGGSGHSFDGIEYSSCAAMEGWATFVSADIWRSGEDGEEDPDAVVRWWNGATGLIPVEGAVGDCPDFDGEAGVHYPRRYGDTCFGDDANGTWDDDANCSGGNCVGHVPELDWLRFWWDFHTDQDIVGTRPTHSQLQVLVDEANGWNDTNVWSRLRAATSGTERQRWDAAGSWNGVND